MRRGISHPAGLDNAVVPQRIQVHIWAWIGQKRLKTVRADLDFGMICFQEDGVTGRQLRHAESGVTFYGQDPCLFRCVERPNGARNKVKLLESKVGINSEDYSRVA